VAAASSTTSHRAAPPFAQHALCAPDLDRRLPARSRDAEHGRR
jgi:hypothetical protein